MNIVFTSVRDSKYGDSASYCSILLCFNACTSSIVTYKVQNISCSAEHQLSNNSVGCGYHKHWIYTQNYYLWISHTNVILIIQFLSTLFDQPWGVFHKKPLLIAKPLQVYLIQFQMCWLKPIYNCLSIANMIRDLTLHIWHQKSIYSCEPDLTSITTNNWYLRDYYVLVKWPLRTISKTHLELHPAVLCVTFLF